MSTGGNLAFVLPTAAELENFGAHNHIVHDEKLEVSAKLALPDLASVKAAFAAALAALLLRWGPVKTAWTEQLTSQVQHAASGDDPTAFARLGVDSSQGAAVLADAMGAYASTAAAHVVAEAKTQGVVIPAQAAPVAQMQSQAAVTAELLAAGLALSAGSEAQRVHRDGRDAGATAADVRAHLDGLTDDAPKRQLGYALHTVELGSRLATLLYSTDVRLYAAEMMDDHRCAPCREVDGTFLGTSGDHIKLDELYPNGGYIGCLGGINCRGTVVGIWPREGES